MLQIKEVVNSIFNSKTYILYLESANKAWLVDIGDINPVYSFCENKRLQIEGVFLTHTHYDHLYGLLSLLEHYPLCKVYTNEYGKEALASEKLNMSKYHETPLSYDGDNVVLVREGNEITLFEGEPAIQIYETPGHSPSCLTMVCGDYIFTGDSYIPDIGVYTHLPKANIEKARESLERINVLAERRFVLPGHKI